MTVVLGASETQAALVTTILLGTFIYEDGATLLAATLSATGRLHPALGLMAAFLGVWIGDVGLYVLGSSFQQYASRFTRLQAWLKPEALTRAQVWFHQNAVRTLMISRMIPGSRLPLYLAAGALRVPFRLFARVTGYCAAVWVSAIFAVWRFAPRVLPGSGLPWVLTAVLLFVPFLIGKRLNRTARVEPLSDKGALSTCAL